METSKLTKELLEIKDEIESTETLIANTQGKLDMLMSQLKKDWGCSSIKEAQLKLSEIDKEITAKTKELDKLTVSLSEDYGWNI